MVRTTTRTVQLGRVVIELDGKPISVDYSYFEDCVMWAYHALVVTTAGGTDPGGAGAGAGGALGAGGMSNGAGGEGEEPRGGSGSEPMGDAGQPASGGSRAGVGGEDNDDDDDDDDGGATGEADGGQAGSSSRAVARDDGGCGCRIPASGSQSAPFAALALALAAFWRRARRRV